jgi:hypothetical protein
LLLLTTVLGLLAGLAISDMVISSVTPSNTQIPNVYLTKQEVIQIITQLEPSNSRIATISFVISVVVEVAFMALLVTLYSR